MDKTTIIKNIENLKTIAIKPNLAYALRVRIFRQTIKLLQNISQILNLPKPDRFEEIREEDITPKIKNVCLSYNSIVKITLSLSQPSESLNEKWNLKWSSFLKELQKLENSVNKYYNL